MGGVLQVRANDMEDKLELSEHNKTTLITVVSLLLVLVSALLSLMLFRKQSKYIKVLQASLRSRVKNERRQHIAGITIQELEQFGTEILECDMNEMNGKELERLLRPKFPNFISLLLLHTASWTSGDREIFIATVLGLSPKNGSKILKTTPNSFRVRKSKMLHRIPASFRSDPKSWVMSW